MGHAKRQPERTLLLEAGIPDMDKYLYPTEYCGM